MLIFFWQYSQGDGGAAAPVSTARIYSVHRSKGLSVGRGLSHSKGVSPNTGLAVPEANDDN